MTGRKFIIDSDPGIDDAMALRFARGCPDLDVVAVTTCFGNADVATTTRNALALCARFGIAAPVHRGAAAPLSIARNRSPVHVHGSDGLGDARRDAVPTGRPSDVCAAEAIVALVRAHPGQVGIVALAPTTNLALALRLDPGIAALVREVVVMGGAFGGGGRRGNVTPVAEANVWNDPHAAQIVFSAGWPVTVVGLDVTMRCVLDAATAAQLAAEGGRDARYLWDISRGYEAIYRDKDGLAGCCIHDAAAMAYALDPTLFRTRAGRLRVVTEGPAIGQTILDSAAGPADAGPPQRVCVDVDAQRLLDLYCERVASPRGLVA